MIQRSSSQVQNLRPIPAVLSLACPKRSQRRRILGNASDALGGKRAAHMRTSVDLYQSKGFSSEDAQPTHCIIRQDYGGNEDEEGLAGWGRGVYPSGSVSFNPSSINSISCCQPSKHMY